MTALTFNQRVQDSSSCGRTKRLAGIEGFRLIRLWFSLPFSEHTGSGNPHTGSPPPICSEAVKAFYIKVPGSGCSPAFPRPSIPAGRFLPMRVVLDGGVCCIPAASEADHSTKEVNTSYRNNIFDFQGTTIKTPNHFTTVGVWCTLTKVKLYCKLSRR